MSSLDNSVFNSVSDYLSEIGKENAQPSWRAALLCLIIQKIGDREALDSRHVPLLVQQIEILLRSPFEETVYGATAYAIEWLGGLEGSQLAKKLIPLYSNPEAEPRGHFRRATLKALHRYPEWAHLSFPLYLSGYKERPAPKPGEITLDAVTVASLDGIALNGAYLTATEQSQVLEALLAHPDRVWSPGEVTRLAHLPFVYTNARLSSHIGEQTRLGLLPAEKSAPHLPSTEINLLLRESLKSQKRLPLAGIIPYLSNRQDLQLDSNVVLGLCNHPDPKARELGIRFAGRTRSR